MNKSEILNKKIIIVNHFYATGPAENLLEFCINKKGKKIMSILHPLMYQKNQKGSRYTIYEKGRSTKNYEKKNKKHHEFFEYIRCAFLNIWWVLKTREKWNIYVGSNNLNAFCGLILKFLGRVDKVVYYTIDFVPQKFKNKLLDRFYHFIDTFCVKHADAIWNLSPRMVEARENKLKMHTRYRKRQFLVPEGVWLERTNRYPLEYIEKHTLVFVGHLVSRLGVQKVIEALPIIKQNISDIKFIIIGKGEYKKTLEDLSKKLGVEDNTKFKGFIPDHKDVEKIISKCAIGMATYAPEEGSLSYFCDPSKTKIYMGCGIPVIMTDMFYNAKEIEEAGGGKIVEYSADDIAQKVTEIISDENRLAEYKKSAIEYIKELDWNVIFTKNLQKI